MKIIKKVIISFLFLTLLMVISACRNSNSEGFKAIFISDTHTTVTIYSNENFNDGQKSNTAYAKDKTTGAVLSDGKGVIYFSLDIEENYELDLVTVLPTSNYQSFYLLDEQELPDYYIIENITGDVTVTITTKYKNTITDDSYEANFILDSHVSVTVYNNQDYLNGEVTTKAYARDSLTGEKVINGDGQINFSLTLDEGFEVTNILVTPSTNYKNLKLPTELGENKYRITKITGALTITITTKEEGQTGEDDSYEANFILDSHVNVTVYNKQDYLNGEVTTKAYARDSESGEKVINGDGQINFSLTLDEGFEVTNILVTPATNYKNFKLPTELGENKYRITKITGDLTITITTKMIDEDYNSYEDTLITFSDTAIHITNNNGAVAVAANIVTISSSGTYYITGSTQEGAVYVDGDDTTEIVLKLEDLSITSGDTSPINIIKASEVTIYINGSVNLFDNRPANENEDDEATNNAALYANADLELIGTGTLNVIGNYNNGIGTKDDLKIENITLNVTSTNHALKGSDSLTIKSGIIYLTSLKGDGLKTSNSDISSKQNQRGTITIKGGSITIHAASDGIDAAYDVIIENNPNINIYTTPTYATGVGTPNPQNEQTLYLRLSNSSYSTNYRYALYLTNSTTSLSTWSNFTYLTYQQGGPGRSYYFYSLELPSGYDQYTLYRFTSSQVNSLTTYNAKSEKANLNSAYDMLNVNSISAGINVGWSMFQQNSANSSKLDYSAKGIKADNLMIINGGTIIIYAYDDGIHTNADQLLENGAYGLGDITINGGNITITTKDDGIHADRYLNINGGNINILTSYEGLEANVVQIGGGIIYVNATDDGVNAAGSKLPPKISITNGYLDISVGRGDTDAIDSNGSYVQTGGIVIAKSAVSGGMGGALDTDGSVSITGGTFIGLGLSERVPAANNNVRSTGSLSLTIAPNDYVIKNDQGNTIISFTTQTYTYSRIFIVSDQLIKGNTYNLIRATTVIKTWAQN